MLGKVGFGELAIIQSTVGMFGIFAGFSLGLTATKYVAEFRNKDPERAGRVVALSGLTATVTAGLMCTTLFLAAPWLAEHTLSAPQLGGLLRIGTLFLFLQALNGAQTGALAGFESFRTIAVVNFVAGISAFPMMTGGAYWGGVDGAVWGLVSSVLVNWILNHIALRIEAARANICIFTFPTTQDLAVLWRFSLPAFFAGAVIGPVVWACNAFLVNGAGGYAQMGIYNAALAIQNLILMVAATLELPLLTAFSNLNPAGDSQLGRVNMLATWSVGVFPALLLICFPELIQTVYGRDFAGPAFLRTVVVVCIFTSIVVYKQGLGRVLLAREMVWWCALSNACWALVLLPSAYFLARYGAIGLALSFLIAYAVNTVIFMPLYTMKKLVPRSTIVSREAFVVWLVLLLAGCASIAETALPVRLLIFLGGIACVCLSFVRLLRPRRVLMGDDGV
jgi:O-antigen/teichoic acid export membrane protein